MKQGYIWRILLVDDDEDDYFLTRSMLADARQGKFQLEWASSYERGREALRDFTYDAVLMDYDMGARTGIELIREAVASGCPVPIILLTGRGTYEVDVEAMQAGAMDYLNKAEINPAFLERSIRYAIERKRSEIERAEANRALADANRALALANEQLTTNRQELSQIIESISDGFFALDREWRFIYINHRAAHNAWREPETLIGKNVWEELPHLLGTELEQRYRQAMQNRQPMRFEWHSIIGPPTWFEVNVYPSAQGISVQWVDTTEQRQIEQDLQRERELLQKLFERIPVMIVIYHPKIHFQQINDAFTRLTRWTSQDVREGDLMALCFPDPNYREEVRAFMSVPDSGWSDLFLTTRHGELLESSWSNLRLSDDTQIGIGIDLREQKLAEQTLLELNALLQQQKLELETKNQQLEGLFENAPASMVLFDAQPPYRLLAYNKFYRELLPEPFRSGSPIGAPIDAIVPTAAEDGLLDIFDTVASTGQAQTIYDFPIGGTAGGRTWWNLALSPVVVEDRLVALAHLAVNISEEVAAREALEAERAFLQAVLDQLPVAVVIIDAQSGRLMLGNQQVEKTWRRTLDRQHSKEPWDYRGFYPDGRSYQKDNQPIARALRGEVVRDEEVVILRGDGSYGVVQVDAAPVRGAQGTIQAGVAIYLDITERKRAERDTQFLIELSDVLNHTAGPEELLATISEMVASQLDCTRCTFREIDSQHALSILHQDVHRGAQFTQSVFPLDQTSPEIMAELQAGRPVINRDTQIDPRTASRYQEIYAPASIRAYIAVPLLREGSLAAAMMIGDSRPRIWNDRQLAFVQAVAERTWAAYETNRLLAALRENEDRFRLASRAIEGYVYDYDLASGRVLRSEGFERLTGFTPEEMADYNQVWLERVHPDDRQQQTNPNQLAPSQEQGAFTIEFRFQRADGAWLTLYDQGMLIYDTAGRPVRLVGITTDITRRKEMEESLRQSEANMRASEEKARRLADEAQFNLQTLETVIDSMKEGVMLCNMQGDLTRVNPSAVALHGFRSEAEMIRLVNQSDELFELHSPDGQPVALEQWPLAAMVREETVINMELHVRRKDSGKSWIGLYSTLTVRNHLGKGLLILKTVVDITQVRRAEQRRREMDTQLKVQHLLVAQREQERLQIARDLHDGPIQDLIGLRFAIRSAISLTSDSELAEILNGMQEEAQKLVNELRGVCNELRPPVLSKFGLSKAIQSHADELNERSGALQIELALDDDSGRLPDETRLALYRIYQESMNNILRHAEATQASVRLHIAPERLMMEIKDDGIGFDLPRDWLQLAQQGHLGLVGIKERAEAIGGSLEITSAPGRGTRVLVILPHSPR